MKGCLFTVGFCFVFKIFKHFFHGLLTRIMQCSFFGTPKRELPIWLGVDGPHLHCLSPGLFSPDEYILGHICGCTAHFWIVSLNTEAWCLSHSKAELSRRKWPVFKLINFNSGCQFFFLLITYPFLIHTDSLRGQCGERRTKVTFENHCFSNSSTLTKILSNLRD